MTPGMLVIEKTFKELTPSCCANKVYALIFNQSGLALKNNAGVYSFASYAAAHASHAIVLTEDAIAKLHYKGQVSPGNLTMPKTPEGEYYRIEYWRRTASNTSYNRNEDQLLDTERFWWSGNYLSFQKMSDEDIRLMSRKDCVLNYAYDSGSGDIHFIAFLLSNGQIDTAVANCEIHWKDRTGADIVHLVVPSTIPGFTGVFTTTIQNVDLNPDDATAMLCKITDTSGNIYTTPQTSVTWD